MWKSSGNQNRSTSLSADITHSSKHLKYAPSGVSQSLEPTHPSGKVPLICPDLSLWQKILLLNPVYQAVFCAGISHEHASSR